MPWSDLQRSRPPWMTVRAPSPTGRHAELRGIMRGAGLHTVCEEARCPNIGECWGRGTATFQILGDVCTRACRYCAVTSGRAGGRARAAGAAPGRPGRRAHGPRPRRRDVGRPRRPARSGRRPFRGDDPLDPAREARRAESRCSSRTSSASARRRFGSCSRQRPMCSTTTSRRPSISTGGCGRRAITSVPSICSTLPRTSGPILHPGRAPLLTKSGLIVGMGESDDDVLGRDARPARPPRRRGHDRAVPPADRAPPAARPVGDAGPVRRVPAGRRGDGIRVGLRGAARPLELPRRGAAARRARRSRAVAH